MPSLVKRAANAALEAIGVKPKREPKPPKARDTLAFRLNRWEKYTWRKALEGLGVEARAVESWMDKRPEWPLLARELFGRLYTGDDLDEVARPAPWAMRVHDAASELPEFARLLDLCRDSRIDSGV